MNKKTKKINFIVEAGLIAAVYAALTYAAAALNLAYGSLQFRFSEALTILSAYTPAAIPGLTIGCFLGNITSPYGILDIICGTLATLIASILGYICRKITVKGFPLLSSIFPVITNGLIIGALSTYFMPEGFKIKMFIISAIQIAFEEALMSVGLGLPLFGAIKKIGVKKLFK